MASQTPFRVEWAPPARADVEAIIDYIVQDRPASAASILDRILRAAASLRTMPLRGRTVPELAEVGVCDYRELILRPWRVVYRVEGGTVYIVAVVDSRRDLADLLLERVVRLSLRG